MRMLGISKRGDTYLAHAVDSWHPLGTRQCKGAVAMAASAGEAPPAQCRHRGARKQDSADDLGLVGLWSGLRPELRRAARLSAGTNRNTKLEPQQVAARRLRKVREGVMANRSDRDPRSLNQQQGVNPSGGMRRGSANSIKASRYTPCTNRPDIELQPVPTHTESTLPSGRRPYSC